MEHWLLGGYGQFMRAIWTVRKAVLKWVFFVASPCLTYAKFMNTGPGHYPWTKEEQNNDVEILSIFRINKATPALTLCLDTC